jgi:hypothetical protein
MKENVGWACGTNRRGEKSVQGFRGKERPKEREHSEKREVDGKMDQNGS